MPSKEELAFQHDPGLLAYQDYVGAVAQHVAVNGRRRLRRSASRRGSGPASAHGSGRPSTVQQRFDWPVVARLHHQLYAELAERRRAGREALG